MGWSSKWYQKSPLERWMVRVGCYQLSQNIEVLPQATKENKQISPQEDHSGRDPVGFFGNFWRWGLKIKDSSFKKLRIFGSVLVSFSKKGRHPHRHHQTDMTTTMAAAWDVGCTFSEFHDSTEDGFTASFFCCLWVHLPHLNNAGKTVGGVTFPAEVFLFEHSFLIGKFTCRRTLSWPQDSYSLNSGLLNKNKFIPKMFTVGHHCHHFACICSKIKIYWFFLMNCNFSRHSVTNYTDIYKVMLWPVCWCVGVCFCPQKKLPIS